MAKKSKPALPSGKAKQYKDLMRLSDHPLFKDNAEAPAPGESPADVGPSESAGALSGQPPKGGAYPPAPPAVPGKGAPMMHEGGLVQHPDELEEMTKHPESEELEDTEDEGSHEMHKALAAHHKALADHYAGLCGDEAPGKEEEYGRMMKDHKQFDELNKLTKKPSEKV